MVLFLIDYHQISLLNPLRQKKHIVLPFFVAWQGTTFPFHPCMHEPTYTSITPNGTSLQSIARKTSRGTTNAGTDITIYQNIHPRKLTWMPKIALFERTYLFQTIIFGIYVRFRECSCFISLISESWFVPYFPAWLIFESSARATATYFVHD